MFLVAGIPGVPAGVVPPMQQAMAINPAVVNIQQQKRRSSTRSIKRKKFDDELVESSLVKSDRGRLKASMAPTPVVASAPSSVAATLAPVPSTVSAATGTVFASVTGLTATTPSVSTVPAAEVKPDIKTPDLVPAPPPPEKKKSTGQKVLGRRCFEVFLLLAHIVHVSSHVHKISLWKHIYWSLFHVSCLSCLMTSRLQRKPPPVSEVRRLSLLRLQPLQKTSVGGSHKTTCHSSPLSSRSVIRPKYHSPPYHAIALSGNSRGKISFVISVQSKLILRQLKMKIRKMSENI